MKLGKSAIMVCPYCEHDTFMRKTTEEIRMVDDGENITDELVSDGWCGYTYRCAKCKRNVTDKELKRKLDMEKVC